MQEEPKKSRYGKVRPSSRLLITRPAHFTLWETNTEAIAELSPEETAYGRLRLHLLPDIFLPQPHGCVFVTKIRLKKLRGVKGNEVIQQDHNVLSAS